MREYKGAFFGNHYKGVIDGYYFDATIFDEPSKYGIKGGRVSKLFISKAKNNGWDSANQVYVYDRGLDFDNAPRGVVDKIIGQLNKIPPKE